MFETEELMNGYGGIPGWMDDEICLFQGADGCVPNGISIYDEEDE